MCSRTHSDPAEEGSNCEQRGTDKRDCKTAARGWSLTALSPADGLQQAAPDNCHVGLRASRLENGGPSGLRERACSSAWQKEQESNLLAHLLGTGDTRGVVSRRDAEVAATVIQWLGTNVGQAFLSRVEADIEDEKAR